MRFENIVRPFQSVDVTYPRPIIKVDATPPANVVLTVGGNGGGTKTLGYSRSYSLTTYMQKVQKEVTDQQPISSNAYYGNPNFDQGVVPGQGAPVGGLPK